MLSQNNDEMRHKFVTRNCQFLEMHHFRLETFRISPPSQNYLYSAPEARCPPHTPSFFYRHSHPPYFATTILIPVGPLSRCSRPKLLERGRLYTVTDLVGFLLTQIL